MQEISKDDIQTELSMRMIARSSPGGLAFVATQNSSPMWTSPKHLTLLNVALTDLAFGRTKRLLVTMPPRHGKCLRGGSPILMDNGEYKAIETIVPGEKVICVDKQSHRVVGTVVKVGNNRKRPTMSIRLMSGRIVRCTHNHPIYTPYGYVNAEFLKIGDIVGILKDAPKPKHPFGIAQQFLTMTDNDILWDRIVEIKELGKAATYDLQVDNYHNFITDGIIVHNSMLCSQFFPAWFIGTFPDKRIILASYEADFAATWGRKARDVLDQYGESVFGIKLSNESNAARAWDIDGHTGGMVTAGVGGPMTGKGCSVLIIDDPVKNMQDASSKTIQDTIYDWYKSTAFTRLEPNGAVLLILTRWHDEDLAGKILKDMDSSDNDDNEPWDIINFPAIAERDEREYNNELISEGKKPYKYCMDRKEGEPLWPERFSLKQLLQIKATVGPEVWSSLYQQHPHPQEGLIFQRSFFKYFTEDDHFYNLIQSDNSVQHIEKSKCWILQTCDPAATEKERSDYFVIETWAIDTNGNMLLIDVFREKALTTKHQSIITNLYMRYNPVYIAVENKTFGLNILQQMRNTGIPVKAVKADLDKVARAASVGVQYEIGKVYHKLGARWLSDYEDELLSFPQWGT